MELMGPTETPAARARTFDRWCRAIAEFGQRTSNELGHAFLYCSQANLWDHNGVLLLGLNPGGKKAGSRFESADGLAYRVQKWGKHEVGTAPVQEQVMTLLSAVTADPERTLCSNVVFYRSPTWAALRQRPEAVEFCAGLWAEILEAVPPFGLRIFIGKRTHDVMADWVEHLSAPDFTDEIPLWAGGRVLVDRAEGRPTTIVLPHLSRWKFIREGNEAFEQLVDLLTEA
jgi:hypothetical protein